MYAVYDDKKWEVQVTWNLPVGARVDKNDWLAVYKDGETDNTAHIKYDFATGAISGTKTIRIKRRVQANDICLVRYVNGANHKTYATSNRFPVAAPDSELAAQIRAEEDAAGMSRGRLEKEQLQYEEDEFGLDGMVAEIRSGIPTSQSLARLRRGRLSVLGREEEKNDGSSAGDSEGSGGDKTGNHPEARADGGGGGIPQAAQADAPLTGGGNGGPPIASTPQKGDPPPAAAAAGRGGGGDGPAGSPIPAAASSSAAPAAAAGSGGGGGGRILEPSEAQRWMWKRGHFRKNWKKRYFDVKDGCLRYAADAPKPSKKHKVKKSLPLATITKIQSCPDKEKRKFVFSFLAKKTSYFVSCESDEVRRIWINYLRALTKQN